MTEGGAMPAHASADHLLDAMPAGFVSFDDGATITLINATLCRRLGYDQSSLVGRTVERILTVGARVFFQTHLFPLIKLEGHCEEIFLLLQASDGSDVGVLCNAVRCERDGRAAIDCVMVEVRGRRKFEDALLEARRTAERANEQLEAQAVELELQHQQLQEQTDELEMQHHLLQEQADELDRQRSVAEDARRAAEDANRAKTTFLATMSHELRTPLNAIGGYSDLLLAGVYEELTPAQSVAVNRIAESGRRLVRLINDVLDLARVESGRVAYQLDDIPLAELIGSLGPMVAPQLLSKSLRYDVRLPPDDVRVRADRDRLIQILLNLLSNAVKFTPAKGEIAVACKVDSTGAGSVTIDVRDTGVGIPAEQLESIFEPFIQVKGTSQSVRDGSDPQQGTGLGLAISRTLARGMGGDLTATSVVGRGSTFTLRLLLSAK